MSNIRKYQMLRIKKIYYWDYDTFKRKLMRQNDSLNKGPGYSLFMDHKKPNSALSGTSLFLYSLNDAGTVYFWSGYSFKTLYISLCTRLL